MSESKQTTGTSILAAMKAGSHTKKIAITKISMKGCSARTTIAVNRQQVVKLQLFEDKGDGKLSGYTPISATIESATRRKIKDIDVYDIKIKFNGAITASHGVAQAMNNAEDPESELIEINQESKNKSLYDILVRCYMCGQEHIPFRSLQRHSMSSQVNIFGVPQYKEALPGKEFCDYNFVRVTVCPKCFFASSNVNDFEREKKTVKKVEEPFDAESIIVQWNADILKRKALIESSLKGFFTEDRSLEQALLSYDLAVITCDALLKAEQEKKERSRDYEIALKAVLYMMIKAELLMSNKKPKAAEKLLKEAIVRLEKVFPYLKREPSIKAAFLLAMLGLYFEEHKLVSQNLTFLQQYDKKNKVRFGTEEQKSLTASLKKMNEAYQNRAEFSKRKLEGFNQPY